MAVVSIDLLQSFCLRGLVELSTKFVVIVFRSVLEVCQKKIETVETLEFPSGMIAVFDKQLEFLF